MVAQAVKMGVPVETACEALDVSKSGYYAYLKAIPSQREQRNEQIVIRLKDLHVESRQTYGRPRLHQKLKQEGFLVGKNRVHRLMKLASISGQKRKRFRIVTTNSNHGFGISERMLRTEEPSTHATEKNQIWVSDLSYIQTGQGFVYLITFMDLFTRKIVGFRVTNSLEASEVIAVLREALAREGITGENLIIHTDRGVQYACKAFKDVLRVRGILSSMSRRGNCYDNAFAESFFATLKKELIYQRRFQTIDDVRTAVFHYIEVWYNRERLHSSLGYKAPAQFETENFA